MKNWLLACASIALAGSLAQADFGPSVWQAMESGEAQGTLALVKAIELKGEELSVKVESISNTGEKSVQTLQLCAQKNEQSKSDEMRAAVFKTQYDLLKEAQVSKTPIEYAQRGPWSPCVSSVRLTSL